MTTGETINSHLCIGPFKRLPVLWLPPDHPVPLEDKETRRWPTFEYDAKRALSDFLANAEMIANDAVGSGRLMSRG